MSNRRFLARVTFAMADVLGWALSAGLAILGTKALMRFFGEPFGPVIREVSPSGLGMIFALGLIVYFFEDLYSLSIKSFWDDVFKIIKANTEMLLIILVASIPLHGQEGSFALFAPIFWVMSCFLNPLATWGAKVALSRTGLWNTPTIVLGAGKTGELVAKEIHQDPYLNYEIVGFLDDDQEKIGKKVNGIFPVMGTIKDLPRVLKEKSSYCVLIAMPGLAQKRLVNLVDFCGRHVPSIQIVPDYFGMAGISADLTDLNGILTLTFRNNLKLERNIVLKRLMDIVLVLISLPLIVPLMAILGLIVRATSDGPALFGHTRLGRNRKPFKCWKFRTMVKDAHRILQKWLAERPAVKAEFEKDYKLKEDPRITPIGKFLRKTSLDELPQLFNVLTGEMSLVGPRPIVRTETKKYGDKARDLFSVKPGLTGLWQVSGRNDISYQERVLLDMFYIKNWSPWWDLTILFRTVKVVLFGRGVY